MPSGTESTVAIVICSSVPIRACSTPPLDTGLSGPVSAIDWVKNDRCLTTEAPLTSV